MAQTDSAGRPGRVALGRILAFSAPSLPLAAMGLPFVVQLPTHYAVHVGIPVAVVGMIFMAARLADIVVDLGIGLAMDQTRTRIGRFTPWLLAGAPLMSIGAWFLFMAEPGTTATTLAITLFLTYCAFSMGVLSQSALGATLSADYHERSRVFAFWQSGNVIGMLLVLSLPVIVHASGGTDAEGVQAMGWFIIVLMPVSAVIAALFAREQPPKAAARRTTLADFAALARSDACRRLLFADLVLMFSSGVTGGLFLFFFQAIKGYGGQASLLLLVYFVAGLLGSGLWAALARRAGKHRALVAACVYAGVSQPLILMLPHASEGPFGATGNLALAAAGMAVAGIVYAAAAQLLRAMMADIGDEDTLATGMDRTGLLYAMVTLTGKAGFALAVGVTFLGLGAVGFDAGAGAANAQSAKNGLIAMFTILPVIACAVSALVLWRYPLDARRTAEVQAALAARRAAQG